MAANLPTLATHQLGNLPQHTTAFPIDMPAPNQTWQAIFNRLPRKGPFTLAFVNRLTQQDPLIALPNRLSGATQPAQLNAYLNAINTIFPRATGPAAGPTTVRREVAATTANGLTGAFGAANANLYHHTGPAVQQHPSAAAGTLTLLAAGPNLTWQNSHVAQGFAVAIQNAITAHGAGSLQHNQLLQVRDTAQTAHAAGTADWHNIVTYIYHRRTFIYDPSAISFDTATAAGHTVQTQLATGSVPPDGLDSHALVNINPARSLWTHGFNNSASGSRGRLGTRNNADGVWIGGGGNVQQPVNPAVPTVLNPGECRAMCGNFILLVHALQWLAEQGAQIGLSAQQRADALFDLDWLLGGFLDSSSTALATANNYRLEWVRVRVY